MDLRKRRSQEKLQVALAHHLQTKTIDEITIGQLTRTAGVSRQTFYSNFDSKQSILVNRIEMLFERSRAYFATILTRHDLGREEVVELALRNLLEECDKDKTVMRAAFTGRAGIQCLSLLKKLLSKLISDRILFQFGHNFSAQETEIISEFIAGGVIGTIQGWLLEENANRELDVVVREIGKLIPHGLDAYIER